jgi:hypothetical protein
MNRDPKAETQTGTQTCSQTGTRPVPSGVPVSDAMIHSPKLLGPATTIAQVRAFFDDDHVHAALLVERGRLLAVIEPVDLVDLAGSPHATDPAVTVGCLRGRVTRPDADLATTWAAMTAVARRRLAVVDSCGNFLGLLCLKRSGLGFCRDADVQARAEERSGAAGSDQHRSMVG